MSDEDKPIVLACNASGLGNKLKAVISAKRIAEREDMQPKVAWYPNNNKNTQCTYDKLFVDDLELTKQQVDSREYSQIIAKRFETWRLVTFADDNIPASPVSGEKHTGLLDGCYVCTQLQDVHNPIDDAYNRIPQHVIDKILPHWQSVKLHPYIIESVSKFMDTHSRLKSPEAFSLVIRSWTELPDSSINKRIFGFHTFLEEIEKRDGPFFVTSEEPVHIDIIKAKYGDRCVARLEGCNIPIDPSEQYAQQVVEGLINVLIAGNCAEMLTSPLTTYSEIGWWLTGAKAKVTKVTTEGLFT